MNEYNEILKQREATDSEITSKYDKLLNDLKQEQSNMPIEKEMDDGKGYITFEIEKKSIETWQYPLQMNIEITSNAQQFSLLTKMPCIGMKYVTLHH